MRRKNSKFRARFAAPAPQKADDRSENTSKIVYILRFRKKQYRLKKTPLKHRVHSNTSQNILDNAW